MNDNDKQKIADEIDRLCEELDEEVRISQFLKELRLQPIERRLAAQYDRGENLQFMPMAMAKLLILQEAAGIEARNHVVETIRDALDIPEDLGFDLTGLPKNPSVKSFKHRRVTPEIRDLIEYTADYLKENTYGTVRFDVGEKNPLETYGMPENAEDDEPEEDAGTDWAAYNEAQTSEKILFKQLAADLLEAVEEKDEVERGRNGYDIRTKLFAMLLQEYTGKSARRTVSELEEAKEQGLVRGVPHFNSLLNFYDDGDITVLLRRLIQVSAKPVAHMEKEFAADATGFSTSVYEEWQDAKFNRPDEIKKYMKLHAMSGTRTNIITAARATDGPSGDSPQFPGLVEDTSDHFTVREISADKAYSSRDNVDIVYDKGGVPYIPFRDNVTGNARGSRVWAAMYRYFQKNRNEFRQHYHRRSNAESTFAMMKRKLGPKLRTEKEVSQRNEILLKCLVHNIIVLIHVLHESPLRIDFNSCADAVFAQK